MDFYDPNEVLDEISRAVTCYQETSFVLVPQDMYKAAEALGLLLRGPKPDTSDPMVKAALNHFRGQWWSPDLTSEELECAWEGDADIRIRRNDTADWTCPRCGNVNEYEED